MNLRNILLSTLTVCATLISSMAYAQFEGQISMKLYSNDEAGNSDVSEINLYATSDRIILKGEDALSLSDGVDASGLLVRNDKNDFVILMGENKALQFTKQELEGAFRMIGMMSNGDSKSGNPEIDDKTDYRYTNRTRTINGYESTELLVESTENSNSLSIWLTAGIDINWGMLAEPWLNVPVSMKESADRVTQEFRSKTFPMLIEVNEDDETKTILEVTNVNRSSIAKAMVEIPAGVTLVGLNEMLFGLMMGN